MNKKSHILSLTIVLLISIFSLFQCKPPAPDDKKSGENKITALVISHNGTDYSGTIAGTNITFSQKVPNGTTQVAIKALSISAKASANKNVGDNLSVGINNIIIVTAEDGSTANYGVAIDAAAPVILSKPTISTGNIANITINSASVSGNITNLGNANITSHGHVWGINNTPTITGSGFSKNNLGTSTSTKSFTTPISGLSENTTYYVRSYATNSVGTSYGDIKSFTTLQPAGFGTLSGGGQTTINIMNAQSGANFSVNITSKVGDLGSGSIVQYGHVYSFSIQGDDLVLGKNNVFSTSLNNSSGLSGKNTIGEFTSTLANLNSTTTYYVRPYITTTAGTVYGTQNNFTTPEGTTPPAAVKPTVSTDDVTGITTSGANINGTISTLGSSNVTAHGHVWATSNNPTITGSGVTKNNLGTKTTTGSFLSSIDGLAENTTYYVRAYATNNTGTSYGVSKSFTTLTPPPSNDVNALTVTIDGTDSYSTTSGDVSGNSIRFSQKVPTGTTQVTILSWDLPSGATSSKAIGSSLNVGANNSVVITFSDGTVKLYIVRIEALSDGKALNGIVLRSEGVNYTGTISGTNVTFATFPYSAENPTINSLTYSELASSSLSVGSTLQKNTSTNLVITAENNTTTTYSVTVSAFAVGENWINSLTGASWGNREGHSSVVFDSKMWIIGAGEDGGRDVWSSSDGSSWTEATNTASWPTRSGHTSFVFDDKMWVLGGISTGNNRLGDIWHSSNGSTWTSQTTSGSKWQNRTAHQTLVHDNKIWVMGGYGTHGNLNDIWYSSDAEEWTQVTVSGTHWDTRREFGAVVFDGKIWVMGGSHNHYHPHYEDRNDVWYSADNGVTWTRATDDAGWSDRRRFSVIVYDNKMWVIGGYKTGNPSTRLTDIWYSSDGANWTKATDGSVFGSRLDGHSTVLFDEKVWILGGGAPNGSKVWYTN